MSLTWVSIVFECWYHIWIWSLIYCFSYASLCCCTDSRFASQYQKTEIRIVLWNPDCRDRWTRTLVSADMLVRLRPQTRTSQILKPRHGRGHGHWYILLIHTADTYSWYIPISSWDEYSIIRIQLSFTKDNQFLRSLRLWIRTLVGTVIFPTPY